MLASLCLLFFFLSCIWRRKKWQPTQVFLLGKFHGQRSLVGYSPWDCKSVRYDLATKQQSLSLKKKYACIHICKQKYCLWKTWPKKKISISSGFYFWILVAEECLCCLTFAEDRFRKCAGLCKYACIYDTWASQAALVARNPPASGEGVRSVPGLGRSSGGGNGNRLQYSCLEKFHGQRSLVGYSPWDCKSVRYDLATKQQSLSLKKKICMYTHM